MSQVSQIGQAAGVGSHASAGRRFASARFYACFGILLVAAIGTHMGASYLEAYFEKKPLPLRAPLYRLNAASLSPYVLAPSQPPPLPPEMIESLGTSEYLDWRLHDPRRQPDDPAYLARLFITYYTGQPDMVPHEPRECMQAGGWRLVSEDSFEVVLRQNGQSRPMTVALLGFEPPGVARDEKSPKLHVMYFFNANGKFVTTRTQVRQAVAGLWDEYAYYAKVEVSFTDEQSGRMADDETSREAMRSLAPVLMDVLWRDHLPEWDS